MIRQVTIENGILQGIPAADPRITAFKGVPFAAPPVGELRWRAPQPAANWTGVRKADQFATISMQEVPGGDPNSIYTREWHVDQSVPRGEDCLYLNIWTPANRTDEKLPVIFWIYGGAFQVGYTSEMEFDGERIARRGVILVSVAYRVNIFGWFAHPEITAAHPDEPTNFGFLDQLAALKWVNRNIAAFGGDPGNVTIAGQSAGGGSVLAHLASPLSRPYFHKAIFQSAGGMRGYGSPRVRPLADVEKSGIAFLEKIGCGSVAAARQLDTQTLFDKYVELGGQFRWGYCIDGKFMIDDPSDIMARNERAQVPCMTGYTTFDLMWTVPPHDSLAAFEAYARKHFGDQAERFLALCRAESGDLAEMADKATYASFELGSAIWCHTNAEQGNKIYYYTFDVTLPGDNAGFIIYGTDMSRYNGRPFHSSELWFTFETLAKCWRPFVGKHYDMARQICNYWTNFAKNGDPNGLDADGTPMPAWQPYTLAAPDSMHFDDACHMAHANSPLMQFLVDYSLDMQKKGNAPVLNPF
jgi:para-nitrobenzyl esterase